MTRLAVASKVLVFSMVGLLIAAHCCEAQDRGRGRGGPGRFGRDLDGPQLLRSEQVREELGLDESQASRVEEILSEARQKQRELFSGLRDLSREERREKFREIREKMQAASQETEQKIAKILKADQQKRLEQISLQVRGSSALADPEVARKLELEREQARKIRNLLAAQRRMRRELFEGLRDVPREQRREKFGEIREKTEELEAETEKAVLAVLTDAQKQKWNDLQGEQFELDRRELFGRFGRRRGRD